MSPTTIAGHHHISVRYLYRLFELDGIGVAAWIRDRRLERCRRELADPTLRHLSIADIGERWGFRSDAHFNRAFRRAYGTSPGAYRRDTQAQPDP